jgi:hypothetical protein
MGFKRTSECYSGTCGRLQMSTATWKKTVSGVESEKKCLVVGGG